MLLTARQREKLVLLNQLIKIRNCLTNPKEYGILMKKSNEQAFDFVALKTAHGRRFESRHQLLQAVRGIGRFFAVPFVNDHPWSVRGYFALNYQKCHTPCVTVA